MSKSMQSCADKKMSMAKKMGKSDVQAGRKGKFSTKGEYSPQDKFTSKDQTKEKKEQKAKTGKPGTDFEN